MYLVGWPITFKSSSVEHFTRRRYCMRRESCSLNQSRGFREGHAATKKRNYLEADLRVELITRIPAGKHRDMYRGWGDFENDRYGKTFNVKVYQKLCAFGVKPRHNTIWVLLKEEQWSPSSAVAMCIISAV